MAATVQFIDGIDEEIAGIKLRKRRNSDTHIVVLLFNPLSAMEKGRSFTNTINAMQLEDEEGKIQVTPSGIRFHFVNNDELSQVECTFEVDSPSAWERVQRFLNRYAEDHGFQFQETSPEGNEAIG